MSDILSARVQYIKQPMKIQILLISSHINVYVIKKVLDRIDWQRTFLWVKYVYTSFMLTSAIFGLLTIYSTSHNFFLLSIITLGECVCLLGTQYFLFETVFAHANHHVAF